MVPLKKALPVCMERRSKNLGKVLDKLFWQLVI